MRVFKVSHLATCVNVWLFISWWVRLLYMCSPSLYFFLPLLVLGLVAVGGCGHTTDVSAASSDLPMEQQQLAGAQARATDGTSRHLPPRTTSSLLLRRLSSQLPVHMLTGRLQNGAKSDVIKQQLDM